MRIPSRRHASLDHIFTQSFFNDREDGISRTDYNKSWNCQPMHRRCNNDRGGQIYGFPLFTCSCHWLEISRTSQGFTLKLHYNTDDGTHTFVVSTEKHHFVFESISTGKHSDLFEGSSEIEVSGVWSMGRLKPGKRGITGKGQLGHAFPRIAPDEVELFNRLEIDRIEGRASETIERFNRRMDPMSMQVHFENV